MEAELSAMRLKLLLLLPFQVLHSRSFLERASSRREGGGGGEEVSGPVSIFCRGWVCGHTYVKS